MLACKVTSSMPQPALCASIWRAGLALLRSAFFAHTIGLLFPLRFGECVFALHLPTLVTWPFIQVFLAQRVPVHRLLLPHVKKKLPSEREASLKWAKWEWTVDQNLLSCTASRHADVRGKWIHATEIGDDARLCGTALCGMECVSEIRCQRELIPCYLELWRRASSIQKPVLALHADWENIFCVYPRDCPARSCLEANKNELRQRIPNDATVGRCCLRGWCRPVHTTPRHPRKILKPPR